MGHMPASFMRQERKQQCLGNRKFHNFERSVSTSLEIYKKYVFTITQGITMCIRVDQRLKDADLWMFLKFRECYKELEIFAIWLHLINAKESKEHFKTLERFTYLATVSLYLSALLYPDNGQQ